MLSAAVRLLLAQPVYCILMLLKARAEASTHQGIGHGVSEDVVQVLLLEFGKQSFHVTRIWRSQGPRCRAGFLPCNVHSKVWMDIGQYFHVMLPVLTRNSSYWSLRSMSLFCCHTTAYYQHNQVFAKVTNNEILLLLISTASDLPGPVEAACNCALTLLVTAGPSLLWNVMVEASCRYAPV